ncbi:MAG: EAL domain-containing protein [Sterolibacterium sp.]
MNTVLANLMSQEGHRQISNYVHLTCGEAIGIDHGDGANGDEYSLLMQEVDILLEKGFPLGLALMMGEMDQSFLREINRIVKIQADYISWVVSGPFVIAVFHQRLFTELQSMWLLVADSADAACGVVFSAGCKDHDKLLLAARIALHRAIARGVNLLVLDSGAAAQAVDDHAIGLTMRKQLASGSKDFEAYYQPQVVIKSAIPCGAEALARWHPDNEEISPSRFIPIAEEAGLIGEIGELMFTLSAQTINVMRRSGIEIPYIAVNVSPLQSRQGDLLRLIQAILRSENLMPSDIEIEITESLAGSGGDEFRRWLLELSAAGFHIAIDDFGTGTSTLARICEIPARTIKLDRAFVSPLPDDSAARAVCRSALELVHALGKTSLAEGVELGSQASYLSSLGCAMGQGFHWARPMAENDLIDWWHCALTGNGLQTRVMT